MASAKRLVIYRKGKRTMPARAPNTGAPGLNRQLFIRAQGTAKLHFHAREHPDGAERLSADVKLLGMQRGGILHEIKQRRGPRYASVINMTEINGVGFGKHVMLLPLLCDRT